MKHINKLWLVGYGFIAALFLTGGLSVSVMAAFELFRVVLPPDPMSIVDRFGVVLEVIGLLTIAVASLQLGQTIIEEEILREAHVGAPTRVRRFLSRFLIVVVVSLSIECLVAVFQFSHADPTKLPYAASIGLAAAALLFSWGIFVKQNRSVEELEPEAMEDAKAEDQRVDQKGHQNSDPAASPASRHRKTPGR